MKPHKPAIVIQPQNAKPAVKPPTLMPTPADANGSEKESVFSLFVEHVRKNKYKTSDLVEIVGGSNGSDKQVRINGIDPIDLTRPEFMVLLILAAHARTGQELPSPRRVSGPEFLSAKDILEEIDKWNADDPAAGMNWLTATAGNVHRAISDLRKKIRLAGGNQNLIESRQRGKGGYRISTSPFNIGM